MFYSTEVPRYSVGGLQCFIALKCLGIVLENSGVHEVPWYSVEELRCFIALKCLGVVL